MFPRVFNPAALENLEEITDNFQETITLEKTIYEKIRSQQWADVVSIYRIHFDQVHKVMAMFRETVLHLAIAHGSEDVVEELVKIIGDNKDRFKNVLQYKNDQGNTPLHVAASTGSLSTCVCIAEADPSMGNERNKEGKSPLFLAALLGRTRIFFHLHSICGNHLDTSYYRKEDGETILHCAIKREYWDLAYLILLLHEELATCVDENGILPIHLLAEKPSAFRSGCHLGWWSIIIYHWTPVDVPKKIDKFLRIPLNKRHKHKFPENFQTCVSFIQLLWRWTIIQVGKVCNKAKNADEENPERSNVTTKSRHEGSQSEDIKHSSFWKYCCAPCMIIKFACRGRKRILEFEEIKKIKEAHRLSVKIMTLCIKPISVEHYFDGGTNPWLTRSEDEDLSFIAAYRDIESECHIQPQVEKETPILSAAKNGIKEMVIGILHKFPTAIHDETRDGKNIVLLAAKYRRTQVYELFRKRHLPIESIFHKLDKKGNSALHLAAELGEQKSGLIPGAALQMQWEIKWYEIVKSTVPKFLLYQTNNENKTPADIFTENHKNLVKEGGEWLCKTSESCSVVAALIATVAYATSTTVPGGVKENSGTPILESHPAFEIFAASSLVALCFSVTALFLFLSILTSRYQEKDFRADLPWKLLLGLTSLFVSIAAMLISFCAGHFFVLKDKLKNRALPVYVVTCLPIAFYAISQFPLYIDLVRAHFKKVSRLSPTIVSL